MKSIITSLLYLFGVILLVSCNDTTSDMATDVAPSAVAPKLEIAPQHNFDQSQLSPELTNLSVQFKNLQGQDRRIVYEQLEPLLPHCPIVIQEDNSADFDFEQAQQRMSPADLTEILGPPDEILQQDVFVYELLNGSGYRVVFFLDDKGTVVCSAKEATS